jgi:coatomer subunit beta
MCDSLTPMLALALGLAGFSDPVYAEAVVNVHQFDILLDVLIVNQTQDTLQNLTIDFATLGDLKLVERPVAHTLAPHGFHSIKATIKVSSSTTARARPTCRRPSSSTTSTSTSWTT